MRTILSALFTSQIFCEDYMKMPTFAWWYDALRSINKHKWNIIKFNDAYESTFTHYSFKIIKSYHRTVRNYFIRQSISVPHFSQKIVPIIPPAWPSYVACAIFPIILYCYSYILGFFLNFVWYMPYVNQNIYCFFTFLLVHSQCECKKEAGLLGCMTRKNLEKVWRQCSKHWEVIGCFWAGDQLKLTRALGNQVWCSWE